jgi:hypothetical protein
VRISVTMFTSGRKIAFAKKMQTAPDNEPWTPDQVTPWSPERESQDSQPDGDLDVKEPDVENSPLYLGEVPAAELAQRVGRSGGARRAAVRPHPRTEESPRLAGSAVRYALRRCKRPRPLPTTQHDHAPAAADKIRSD